MRSFSSIHALQTQLYEDDFATEREAREKTVAKLGNQHKVNGELRNRIESLERDKKELRAQLNQHAARQFQEEFAEVYTGVVFCYTTVWHAALSSSL